MLDDEPYATAFGPASPAHYLTGTLEHEGELLVRYYAVAHEQLANAIALVSGQGPTPQTAQNCPTYENVVPGSAGAEGQVSGSGCVYPSATQTLAGQLAAKHLTWRSYQEGMDEPGAGAGSADGACGHPALGAPDPTSAPTPPAGQTYATWRNPFVYFHSLIDSSACAMTTRRAGQARSRTFRARGARRASPTSCPTAATTATRRRAHRSARWDECRRRMVAEGRPGDHGLKGIQENGLLVLTVDEAPSSGEYEDSVLAAASRVSRPAGAHGRDRAAGRGTGRRAAALAVHQRRGDRSGHVQPLLAAATVEDLYGLGHLGYAGGKEVSSFAPALFTKSG